GCWGQAGCMGRGDLTNAEWGRLESFLPRGGTRGGRWRVDQAGTGRTPLHLAEVLAAGLTGQEAAPGRPEAPGSRALLPCGRWRC
ncbi:hypothetical protein O3S80_28315, partial [Streptomyces sp. Lzd4kr]|nr:hypothetical protein [Streptomyces sp. Lzd4kr]